jgi:membrane protease YdiL (CAAX protease family)
MELSKKSQENVTFFIILTTVFLLPILFFGAIKFFHLSGLPVYFTQLGLYVLFFILAFWGIKTGNVYLPITIHTILDALFFLVLAWMIYVLVLSMTGIIQFSKELAALKATPFWKIGAQILSTWIFVGIAEELLFRGYLLERFQQAFVKWSDRKRTVTAVLVSSLLFALWHIPVRIYELVNGESSIPLILLSVVILFVMGVGFSWLFIRSGNILLVGLVHGVMDYPLIGGDSQMTLIILVTAILCVELFKRRRLKEPEESEF